MNLTELIKLCDASDAGEYDLYSPKDGIVPVLTDDEGMQHEIECFSIQQVYPDDDTMGLFLHVPVHGPLIYHLNDEGLLNKDLNIKVHR